MVSIPGAKKCKTYVEMEYIQVREDTAENIANRSGQFKLIEAPDYMRSHYVMGDKVLVDEFRANEGMPVPIQPGSYIVFDGRGGKVVGYDEFHKWFVTLEGRPPEDDVAGSVDGAEEPEDVLRLRGEAIHRYNREHRAQGMNMALKHVEAALEVAAGTKEFPGLRRAHQLVAHRLKWLRGEVDGIEENLKKVADIMGELHETGETERMHVARRLLESALNEYLMQREQ